MPAITLITGGPGSGKSTIAKSVARHFPLCLVINVDELREMQVCGRSPPERGWCGAVLHEYRRARATANHMARLYAIQGIEVIIDDVCVPPEFVVHYAPFSPTRARGGSC